MKNQSFDIVRVSEDHEYELVYDIRSDVFQEEYDVPEEDELDGNDHIAHHYLALADGEAVGTARWRISLGGKIKLERIAVLKEFRKLGVGKLLMDRVLKDIPKNRQVYLHAMLGSIGFYEKFGFVSDGEQFEEAGVDHQKMILQ